MITKIELKQMNNNFDISLITVDLINKNTIYKKNDVLVKNVQININIEELTDLVKEYITYWGNKYVDNTIIGGAEDELNIYTNDEILEYRFKNKYPYNYNEFLKALNEMVGIIV